MHIYVFGEMYNYERIKNKNVLFSGWFCFASERNIGLTSDVIGNKKNNWDLCFGQHRPWIIDCLKTKNIGFRHN